MTLSPERILELAKECEARVSQQAQFIPQEITFNPCNLIAFARRIEQEVKQEVERTGAPSDKAIARAFNRYRSSGESDE